MKQFMLILLSSLAMGCAGVEKPQLIQQQKPNYAKDWLTSHSVSETEKIYRIAVLEIQDKTGSLETPGGSRSVSQGLTELIKHLLNKDPYSKFAVQHDRQNLDTLLRERSIAELYNKDAENVTSSSRLNTLISPAVDTVKLSKLMPVEILISGAVVGYDKTIKDTANGLSLNVFRASEKTSIDEVELTLFFTDVETGEVFGSFSSRQKIRSSTNGVGYLGYPSRDLLFEIESGWTANESITLALLAASEECLAYLTRKLHLEKV